jgi:hypothetical protein
VGARQNIRGALAHRARPRVAGRRGLGGDRRAIRRMGDQGRLSKLNATPFVSEDLSVYGSHLIIRASRSLDPEKANFLFVRDPG